MVTENKEKQRKVLDEIAKELPQIPLNSTPPEMGRKIHKIVQRIAASDGPGTFLSLATNEFRTCFNKAKLTISKGQGNYETLSEVNKPIFFLLKAKCPVIAKALGCKAGDIVLKGCARKFLTRGG